MQRHRKPQKPLLLRTHLWQQVLVAMVLGIGLGLLLSPSGVALLPEETAYNVAQWVAVPGQLFLAMIQMVVIPLVISSIILGITSSGDASFLKKAGVRIVPYFITTTVIAVVLGITVATILRPGHYIAADLVQSMVGDTPHTVTTTSVDAQDISLPQRIASLVPANPFRSLIDKDMFAIVVYAIFIGVALIALEKRQNKLVLDLLSSIQALTMKIVNWAMTIAPLAVFGLLCDITIRVGIDALLGMSVYVASVLLGLLLLLGIYVLIVVFAAKKTPGAFLRAIREPQLLAFSTSSSAAVMPLSMQTAHEKLGVRKSIAQFIIPLGATINMDGTALYQVVAAVFLTQVFGIDLTLSELLLLIAITVGASIGTPSTPGVGIVVLATILQGVGVPISGIALILGVDRILDMCRTTVNVTGDLTACVVMDRWIGKEIAAGEPTQPLPEVT
ncbi:MAG: dicarboxylate/amino acid:cation symporter [Proteobacteria bacterium]|nr:MAG: dicarboxylate/amino acid:cation symporter [Pseudomonadota bacterium]QKK11472.1 MAG: dicarboxylate/amino acid:cation symporter [Pseudomonadota bacterium]